MRDHQTSNDRDSHTDLVDEIWLLGQPPLRRYLEFMDVMGAQDSIRSRAALIDEWRIANDHYGLLEVSEAGAADAIQTMSLPPELSNAAAYILDSPYCRRTLGALPATIEMVELDRLVVFQRNVTADFIDGLKVQLGPAPDSSQIFKFCFPSESPDAEVQMRQVGSQRFIFQSTSSDFRFHEAHVVRATQISGLDPIGPISAIVSLMVGFGSNLLNAIRVDNRLLLHNGYHRACALRDAGISYAPCLVQHTTRHDELQVVAPREVVEDAAFYFRSRRPPLLKDFFDPKVSKRIRAKRRVKTVELRIDVEQSWLPSASRIHLD